MVTAGLSLMTLLYAALVLTIHYQRVTIRAQGELIRRHGFGMRRCWRCFRSFATNHKG